MVKCEVTAWPQPSQLDGKMVGDKFKNFVIHKVWSCCHSYARPVVCGVIISLSAGSAPTAHFQCWFKGWIVTSITHRYWLQCHSFTEKLNGETISVRDHYKFRYPFPPLSGHSLKKPETPLNSPVLCWGQHKGNLIVSYWPNPQHQHHYLLLLNYITHLDNHLYKNPYTRHCLILYWNTTSVPIMKGGVFTLWILQLTCKINDFNCQNLFM